MTESMIQSTYAGRTNQVGPRDGFREQVVLLDNLREKLDEYFSIKKIRNPE